MGNLKTMDATKYIRRKKLEIPPLFPIYYSKRDIYRLQLFISEDKDFIIKNKWARDSNIFLMAAGGSGKDIYFFQTINL